MPDPRSSFLRRLASFGPLGLSRRARDLLLRPARHELEDARREAVIRAEGLQGELATLRQELAALREAVVAGEERGREESRRQVEAALAAPRHALLAQSGRLRLLEELTVLAQAAALPLDIPEPPLVSIVMPTWNRAACLGDAIRSVVAQSWPHWELLVVDDGSEDGTAQLLAGFTDPRIRCMRIGHAGPSAARNHALRQARGELVAYLDSDNAWFPGFLAGAVAAFAADPALELGYGVLATESHGGEGLQLLAESFDRDRLEQANYIDLNAVVHRRALFQSLGGFDESLPRLIDWDLVLRYTAQRPARALPVLAARYRVRDEQRITDTVPAGPAWLAIRRRLDARPPPPRPPRALYVLWHYPQLSETYVEGEIRCLRRMGAEVAVWHEIHAVSPYVPQVPMHSGDLAALVREYRPDVVHVHWLGYALGQGPQLAALGVPVTVRMHGFDVRAEPFRQLLAAPWLHRVYAFPRQLALLDAPNPRVRAVPAAFDTSYFGPVAQKDPRLVVRAGACLPSKDIPLFFELARRLPSHRFVFAGVTVNEFEDFPAELRRIAKEMDSPVELRFDLPREEVAALIGSAGIYLHTIRPPGAEHGAPIGMPISIAEAMATGAWTLVRDEPELAAYVGDAGATYRDIDEAETRVRASMAWDAEDWRRRRVRACDFAFTHYADEVVFGPVFRDWCALAAQADAGTVVGAA
jgi:glycosyltransferase involved in cell wall biosynthesis